MSLSADQITIAVTVYSRRQYVRQAVASALNQTVPARVIVVEDCGPDTALQDFVKEEFGPRIEYFRSPKRRGIFGNWNACLEQCRTEWLSILHDDDLLAPNFVAAILKLAEQAPGRDLYCGCDLGVNERNEPLPGNQVRRLMRPLTGSWMEIGLKDLLYGVPFYFPGQLFAVASAQAVRGFRVYSHCCGDWEMWAKLAARHGAAQTSDLVAFYRIHGGWDKGLNQVYRNGKHMPANILQHKRVLALLPPSERMKFDRVEWQRHFLTPVFYLLNHGASFSPRLLRYHVGLLLLSPAPHWRYAVFQQLARLFGVGFVRTASRVWRLLRPSREGN